LDYFSTVTKLYFVSFVQVSYVCLDVEFVINSALADDGANFLRKVL